MTEIASKFLAVLWLCGVVVQGYMVDGNPYRQREVMDAMGNYVLEWEYMPEKKTIVFNVTVKCEGYVGLGIAKRESMLNADFLVAGVNPDGTSYCKDMHTKGNRTLIFDKSQDWTLLKASEEKGVTCLSFSRPINTCDEDDVEITEGRTVLLWSYGENDTLGYHYHKRGFKDAYLLDPKLAPELGFDEEKHQSFRKDNLKARVWPLRRTSRLEPKPTTYFCSIHRGPQIHRKNQMIGFRAVLGNEDARRHTHHFVVYKCHAPEGLSAKSIFEPFVDYPGEECHFSENRRLPVNFCRQMVYVWGVGGEPLFLNDNVGIPVEEDEYFMFETHFDNRDLRQAPEFEVGVDFYLTNKLRPRDGTMLMWGYMTDGATTLFPPASINFDFIGQCDDQCTLEMLPPEGVKVSAVFLHSHTSARRLTLRRFRKGRELAPILTDDNYNPTYQQYRNLDEEVNVLPGDHLAMESVLDNTQFNGSTVGGFGTHQEMGVAFVVVDHPVTHTFCLSQYPADRLFRQIGVQNITWDTYLQDRVVTEPAKFSGLTLGEVGDTIKWTTEKRKYLQEDMTYGPHIPTCPDVAIRPAQEIIDAAEAQERIYPRSRSRSTRLSTESRGQPPTVTYTGIGFSKPESDPGLQIQVQRAAQLQLSYGSRGLLQRNDAGAIIMRASTGNPILRERISPVGLSNRDVPARTRLPRPNPKETVKMGWGRDECERKGKDHESKEEDVQFLQLRDLQQINERDGFGGGGLSVSNYNLGK